LNVVIIIHLHNHELLFVVKLSHKEWLPFGFVLALGIRLNLVNLFLRLALSIVFNDLRVGSVIPLAAIMVRIVLDAPESR